MKESLPDSRIIAFDFSASELAEIAAAEKSWRGFNQVASRLIFAALEKNRYEPLGLELFCHLCLEGNDQLAALLLEYALAVDSPLNEEERKPLDDLRFFLKWKWGFSQHKSGRKTLHGFEFEKQSNFIVDEARYWIFLSPKLSDSGSLVLC